MVMKKSNVKKKKSEFGYVVLKEFAGTTPKVVVFARNKTVAQRIAKEKAEKDKKGKEFFYHVAKMDVMFSKLNK